MSTLRNNKRLASDDTAATVRVPKKRQRNRGGAVVTSGGALVFHAGPGTAIDASDPANASSESSTESGQTLSPSQTSTVDSADNEGGSGIPNSTPTTGDNPVDDGNRDSSTAKSADNGSESNIASDEASSAVNKPSNAGAQDLHAAGFTARPDVRPQPEVLAALHNFARAHATTTHALATEDDADQINPDTAQVKVASIDRGTEVSSSSTGVPVSSTAGNNDTKQSGNGREISNDDSSSMNNQASSATGTKASSTQDSSTSLTRTITHLPKYYTPSLLDRFEKAVRLSNDKYHRYAIGEAPLRRMHWQSQFFSIGSTTVTFLMLGRVTRAYFVAEDGGPPDRSFVRFKLLRDSDGVIARRLLHEYARPPFTSAKTSVQAGVFTSSWSPSKSFRSGQDDSDENQKRNYFDKSYNGTDGIRPRSDMKRYDPGNLKPNDVILADVVLKRYGSGNTGIWRQFRTTFELRALTLVFSAPMSSIIEPESEEDEAPNEII